MTEVACSFWCFANVYFIVVYYKSMAVAFLAIVPPKTIQTRWTANMIHYRVVR